MDATKRAAAVALGLIAAALLAAAVWFGYWWLHRESVNREASISRGSFEVQQTYREQVLKRAHDVADIDTQLANPDLTTDQKLALQAQRRSVVNLGCDQVQRLVGSLPPEVEEFATIECGSA